MYDLIGYGAMVADERRTAAYAAALSRTVRPGAVVLDLGAGTGLLSLLACRAGASRVYAVDVSPFIQLAREICAANGYGDRVTCIEARSERVSLPESADLLVSDVRGVLPLVGEGIRAVIDARDRLVRPGATLIAKSDRLLAAIAHSPRTHAQATGPWSRRPEGFDMSPAARVAHNLLMPMLPDDDVMLSGERFWAELDYATISSLSVRGGLEFLMPAGGVAHGLCLWFESTLAEGVTFSSGPSAGPSVYGRALLPWPRPVTCGAGTEVAVEMRADYIGGEYVWTWHTRIGPRDGSDELRFRQSTLAGPGVSPERLRRRSAQHVPSAGREAEIELTILSLMREGRSLGNIARALRQQFTGAFRDEDAALARAADVAERCGER
jgi:type I protein arginine methyltransferase